MTEHKTELQKGKSDSEWMLFLSSLLFVTIQQNHKWYEYANKEDVDWSEAVQRVLFLFHTHRKTVNFV